MIFSLYNIKKEYRDKKIYIWNVNRNSMGILLEAALMRIDIQGFVVAQDEYAGERYMNRPVLSIEQIKYDDAAIVLVSEEVSPDIIGMIPQDKVIRWSQCLEIDEDLKKKKLIVYGIGRGAEQLDQELSAAGAEVDLFCVTKSDGKKEYKGKKVISVDKLEDYKNYAVIVSVTTRHYIEEILKNLYHFHIQVYISLECFTDKTGEMVNLMQDIDDAIKNNKKVYLYSKKGLVAEWIEDALSIYGVKIAGYVYESANLQNGIESIYELAFEGIEDKLIILNELLLENLVKARGNIELAGFSLEKGNYAAVRQYTYANNWMIMASQWHTGDPLLCQSIIYPEGLPGWKVYGKSGAGVKIVVLGGSTSSEALHPENWISKLYYRLKKENIDTVIYNGAHICNDIVSEMLRFLRDGYVLKPQIVISMSGLNNTYHKDKDCVNQFNDYRAIAQVKAFYPEKYCSGVESDESLYSFWRRNMKLLQLIAESQGARFFGFLQPMNVTMKHMSLREKSLYEKEMYAVGSREFSELADDESEYINLMRIFEHQDEMFFDTCHYTDKGHEVIANKVYEVTKSVILNALSIK